MEPYQSVAILINLYTEKLDSNPVISKEYMGRPELYLFNGRL